MDDKQIKDKMNLTEKRDKHFLHLYIQITMSENSYELITLIPSLPHCLRNKWKMYSDDEMLG